MSISHSPRDVAAVARDYLAQLLADGKPLALDQTIHLETRLHAIRRLAEAGVIRVPSEEEAGDRDAARGGVGGLWVIADHELAGRLLADLRGEAEG
jgi:hypothetical protein